MLTSGLPGGELRGGGAHGTSFWSERASAAPIEVVAPLAQYLQVDDAIATRARVDERGRYTGELEFSSHGANKVVAMEHLARRHVLARCWAYSDSVTDLPMLEAVGHPVAVNPDRTLRRLAEERGWEVRDFTLAVPLRGRTPGAAQAVACGNSAFQAPICA